MLALDQYHAHSMDIFVQDRRRGNWPLACPEQGLRKNNWVANSHLPVRRREHKMQRFKSPGSAQRFLSKLTPPSTTISASS
jgi:transposase-like protein